MPLVVWAAPALCRWWLDDEEMGLMFAAAIIPILALVVWYYIAIRYIERNHCGKGTQRFQRFTLRAALLYLLCLESLIITIQDLPGANDLDVAAVLFLLAAYLIYLLPMAFVLYPGKRPSSESPETAASETCTNYFGGEDYV